MKYTVDLSLYKKNTVSPQMAFCFSLYKNVVRPDVSFFLWTLRGAYEKRDRPPLALFNKFTNLQQNGGTC